MDKKDLWREKKLALKRVGRGFSLPGLIMAPEFTHSFISRVDAFINDTFEKLRSGQGIKGIALKGKTNQQHRFISRLVDRSFSSRKVKNDNARNRQPEKRKSVSRFSDRNKRPMLNRLYGYLTAVNSRFASKVPAENVSIDRFSERYD